MGVRGLSTYIEEYLGDVLEYHRLHNCKVIIDGNNLAHVLYYQCPCINTAFGGDYDIYSAFVTEYFEKFRLCEISPLVLLDGGQPLNSRKFRTVKERTLGQIRGSLTVKPSNQERYKLFPCMARQVFVSVLKSMNIPVYQTDFEADLEIATLALTYDFKVISCDSDFYIYDCGFIRLDSIHHKKMTWNKAGKYNYLACKYFNMETFCERTGLDVVHLPLLATILGNDYLAFDHFIPFYDMLRKGKNKSKRMSDRHNTIKNVIGWLAKYKGKPINSIIKKVIEYTVAPRMFRTINRSMANYTAFKSNLTEYIQQDELGRRLLSSGLYGKEEKEEREKKGEEREKTKSESHGRDQAPHHQAQQNTVTEKLGSHSNEEEEKEERERAIFESHGGDQAPHHQAHHPITLPSRPKIPTNLKSKDGLLLPAWFIDAYRRHIIPHEVADIMTQKYFISSPFVEVEHMPSTYLVARRIVKSVFAMLWKGVLEDAMLEDAMDSVVIEKGSKLGKNLNSENTKNLDSDSDFDVVVESEEEIEMEEDKEIKIDRIEEKKEETMEEYKEIDDKEIFEQGINSFEGDSQRDSVIQTVKSQTDLSQTLSSQTPVYPQILPSQTQLSPQNLPNKKPKKGMQKLMLSWYMRKGTEFKTEIITLTPERLFNILPSIHQVSSMSMEKKRRVFIAILTNSNTNYNSTNSNSNDSSDSKGSKIFNSNDSNDLKYSKTSNNNNNDNDSNDVKSSKTSNNTNSKTNTLKISLTGSLDDLELPGDLELILYFIMYWIKNTRLSLRDNHTLAVLMCAFQFYIIDGKIGRLRSHKTDEEMEDYKTKLSEIRRTDGYNSHNSGVSELLSHLSIEECVLANSKLLKYHNLNPYLTDRTYDKKYVHAFGEYQACIYFIQLLNSLLGTPYPSLSVERLWGGTFCYNIFIGLKKQINPLNLVSKLLGIGTCLEMLFLKLYSKLGDVLNFEKTDDFVESVVSRSESVAEKKRVARKREENEESDSKISTKKKTKRGIKSKKIKNNQTDLGKAKSEAKKTYALNNQFASLILDSEDSDDDDDDDRSEEDGNENRSEKEDKNEEKEDKNEEGEEDDRSNENDEKEDEEYFSAD